jgi:hypothetical protein
MRPVLRLDDYRGLLRQQLGDARLVRIEIQGTCRIEQCEYAHDALGRMAHRASQYLVRSRDLARNFGDVIHHDGALLQLHPRQQMLLRAFQGIGRHRLSAARLRQRNLLVGNPQGGKGTTHVLESRFQDQVEFIGVVYRCRLMRGNFEHQGQIALAYVEILFA